MKSLPSPHSHRDPLLEAAGDDESLLAALRSEFVGSISAAAHDLYEAADDKTAQDAAHRLKGAALTFGALSLAELARIVERSPETRQGHLAAIRAEVTTLAGD